MKLLYFLRSVAHVMAAEIEYENDEGGPWRVEELPETRWQRIRNWVALNIINKPT